MPQATTAGDGSKDQAASPGGVRPERRVEGEIRVGACEGFASRETKAGMCDPLLAPHRLRSEFGSKTAVISLGGKHDL